MAATLAKRELTGWRRLVRLVAKRLPKRPWTAPAVVVVISVILLPALLLAELRQPLFTVSPAGVVNLAIGVPEAVIRFIAELLLTATLTGGLLGWWLGRTMINENNLRLSA